ncbi:hypothetical protein [Pararcticibacter amylolyticus]|uniref:hypothetical protein n=1 Tax=Pararcticibacter amylolyticus TaxID=2173175 RepID=UPI001304DFE0|nr:hypothetical protein [Pararcticibacter amylolyticus]
MGEGLKGLVGHDCGDVWVGVEIENGLWGAWEVEVIGLKKGGCGTDWAKSGKAAG